MLKSSFTCDSKDIRRQRLSHVEQIDIYKMSEYELHKILSSYNELHFTQPFNQGQIKRQAQNLFSFFRVKDIDYDDYLRMSVDKSCFNLIPTYADGRFQVKLGFRQAESQMNLFWNLLARNPHHFTNLAPITIAMANDIYFDNNNITSSAIEVIGRNPKDLQRLIPVLAAKGNPLAVTALCDLISNPDCSVLDVKSVLDAMDKGKSTNLDLPSSELLNRKCDSLPTDFVNAKIGIGSFSWNSIADVLAHSGINDTISSRPDFDALRNMLSSHIENNHKKRYADSLKDSIAESRRNIRQASKGPTGTLDDMADYDGACEPGMNH
jgi:hypothetical protein